MKEPPVKPEMSLIQRLQKDDEEALASLMKMYYDDLYNYGCRFTSDQGLVKDCIQEVFISLWQRRETAGSIMSPKFYFIRAIKNKVLKTLHKNLREAGFSHLHEEYDFFYEFSVEKIIIERQVTEERAWKIRKTLSLLSQRQKEIIYLKYYQHLEHGQIAELMNISRQSVYNLLYEAINKLRSLWHAEFLNH